MYWQEAVAEESTAVKNNLDEILRTIARLDSEYPSIKEERKRRSTGDDLLLSLMEDYNDHITGIETYQNIKWAPIEIF